MKATRALDASLGQLYAPEIVWLAIRGYPVPKELPVGFADWFRGSLATEPNTGKPRIFYHGSDTQFTHFKSRDYRHAGTRAFSRKTRKRSDNFVFLTADPSFASVYGEWVMVAFLNFRKPYRVPCLEGFDEAVSRGDELRAEGYDCIVCGDRYQSEYAIFDPDQAWIVASYPSLLPRIR